jgi:pectin methylesterase-like acyl-CoA thioesterase
VAADGSGNFTTIQAAVNSTNSVNATIYIKKGIYQEKLVIPTEKSGSEQRLKIPTQKRARRCAAESRGNWAK